jgi:hypothetical protein
MEHSESNSAPFTSHAPARATYNLHSGFACVFEQSFKNASKRKRKHFGLLTKPLQQLPLQKNT